ncbi:MAG: hypothetical protein E7130_00340 [Rikenellaceae bacterium]|nr:hypothetical protein [Rikenellaceae bacterium]
MRFLRYITICVSALLISAVAIGANDAPTITSRIEPDSIMIGDRFTYIIDVEKDMVQEVAFPEFEADPKGGVELVESHPIDTISREGRRLHLRKRYTMAAFEEGRISMGAAKVLYADKNIIDTLTSNDEAILNVATFQIDSTSHAIFDIKPQMKMKFKFREISDYLLWSLLAAVILAGAVYGLVRWLHSRGKSIKSLFTPAPPEPAHIVAIRALEELHNRKLWQNNLHKEYYSGLSDILRTYLAGRYDVGAMEMTTDEIAEAVRDIEMPTKASVDLMCVLRDADLAKFAKEEPDAEQNESAYSKAYYFVEETKPAEQTLEGEDEQAVIDKIN